MSIEKYDPIKLLGEGSFGKVYLMRDKVKRIFVCVKVIKIKSIPKKGRESTKIEVDLLRRLNHPNIVRYYESFLSKNNETLCICMEYCDGGDLAAQIKAATLKKTFFSESKILHWFVQIALGLHYMHANKVLHRDLKTQNVFLLGNGRVVLGDFGISKVLDGTMDFAQTCIGTPYYMSPEIFQNKPYSYKSDVWALGCVLYEMTMLSHAFDSTSLNSLAGKIVKGRYPPINQKYSRSLREMISDMLLINPQQRPDLDTVLRKSFIKKHVVSFLSDIVSRPTDAVGEGTLLVRAAAGGVLSGQIPATADSNVVSLYRQLIDLDMSQCISQALSPQMAPSDSEGAKRLAREQLSALHREEERKKLVESALERLRLDRATRLKYRHRPSLSAENDTADANGYANRQAVPLPVVALAPISNPNANALRDSPVGYSNRIRVQSVLPLPVNNLANNNSSNNNNVARPSSRQPISSRINGSPSVGQLQPPANSKESNNPIANCLFGRNPSIVENNPEAGKRSKASVANVDPRSAHPNGVVSSREERRRSDIKEKEVIKGREIDDLAKQRMDSYKRQQGQQHQQPQEQQQLQQVSVKRIDSFPSEKERLKQREEIEQLKRDKVELDRLSFERMKRGGERNASESKLSVDYVNGLRDAKPIHSTSSKNNLAREQNTPPEDKIEPPFKREQSSSGLKAGNVGNEISARDRVLQLKQERIAREEFERREALREAGIENRRFRVSVQDQERELYTRSNIGIPLSSSPPTSSKQLHSSRNDNTSLSIPKSPSDLIYDNQPPYSRITPPASMRSESKNDRYSLEGYEVKEQESSSRSTSNRLSKVLSSDRLSQGSNKTSSKKRAQQYVLDENFDERSDGSLEQDELFESYHPTELDENDEVEDLYRKEEELQQELLRATQRCQELHKTLKQTRTYIGATVDSPSRRSNLQQNVDSHISEKQRKNSTGNSGAGSGVTSNPAGWSEESSDCEEDDFEKYIDVKSLTLQEPEQLTSVRSVSNKGLVSLSVETGPHTNTKTTPNKVNGYNHHGLKYMNLQDPPTPSGRLIERICHLRQKCVDGLGEKMFTEAYRALQIFEERTGVLYDDDFEEEKTAHLRRILGSDNNKLKYVSLIEQLMFMEETHK